MKAMGAKLKCTHAQCTCASGNRPLLNMTPPFKYLPYKMASVHAGMACMCRRNAACFIDLRVVTRIRFDLQDGDFHSKKGLFNTIYKG